MDIAQLLAPPFPGERRVRQTEVWHASSLGRCFPRMILSYHGLDSMDEDLGLALTNVAHDYVRDLLAWKLNDLGDHAAIEFSVSDERLNLAGTLDIVSDHALIDVKTANSWIYKRHLEDSAGAYWWDQLESYLRMAERQLAHLVLVDRNSSPGAPKFHVFEHRRADARWSNIVARLGFAQTCVDEDAMPRGEVADSLADPDECNDCRYRSFCLSYDRVSEFVEGVREALS